MKIEGNRPAQDTQATDGTRRAGNDLGTRPGTNTTSVVPSSDRVELSGDAALTAAAFKAASDSQIGRAHV